MAGVQDVEAAVGEDDLLPGLAGSGHGQLELVLAEDAAVDAGLGGGDRQLRAADRSGA